MAGVASSSRATIRDLPALTSRQLPRLYRSCRRIIPSPSNISQSCSSIPAQNFSTYPPLSVSLGPFFTPRSRNSQGPSVRTDFLECLEHKNPIDIDIVKLRASYLSLFNSISQDGQPSLRPGEIMVAMDILSRRSDNSAQSLLRRIYADLRTWGITVEGRHHRAILRGLCSAGKPAEALHWGRTHEESMDNETWRLLLSAAVKFDLGIVQEVIPYLRQDGLEGSDYALLFKYLRLSMPIDARDQLKRYLAEMRDNGIWAGKEGDAELVRLQIALNDLDRAGLLVDKWKMDKEDDRFIWNAYLRYQIAKGDEKAMKQAMLKMKKIGLDVTHKGVTYLLEKGVREKLEAGTVSWVDIVKLVEGIEKEYLINIKAESWSSVLGLLSKDNQNIDTALQLYDEIRSRGIQIDSQIARSLILPLCKAHPSRFREAMDIYLDWTLNPLVISNAAESARAIDIFSTLLFTSSSDIDPSINLRVIKDMRSNNIPASTSILTSLMVHLIRSSGDHIDAFNFYAHLYAVNPPALNAKSYEAITSAYLTLSTPTSPFAPPQYFVEILKDIQKAGYHPGPHILTSLLDSYGDQALNSRKTSSDPVYLQTKIDKLHKAISDIHNLIKLESIVNVDNPLLNALMDSYNKVGAYSSAFEVWDQIVQRRPTNLQTAEKWVKKQYETSVGIVLDVCGRSGALGRGKRIWIWAKRFGLDSTKVSETWVENLCRLGKLDEAVEMVCEEVERFKVGKEMIRILVKFGKRDGRARELNRRLKEEFPYIMADLGDRGDSTY